MPDQDLLATKVTSAKPKLSSSQILVIISAFLLTIVIGVGGTLGVLALNGQFSPAPTRVVHLPTQPATNSTPIPTATATQQANALPTPNSFVITTNKAIGVSLKYPGDWIQDPPQVSSSGTSVSFHPQQQLGINFGVERFSDSASAQIGSADELNQNTLQGLSTDSNLHNYKEVPAANATPTIAGVQWAERDATFANSNGNVFHAVSIAVKHGSAYYSIFYFAPSAYYAEAMQKYYSQMLSSFQFTS